MILVSKNVYIDKLNDIVNKYNNTYHSTVKMKRIDIKSSAYIHSSKEISKHKNVFAKGYTPNSSGEVFLIKKVKNTVPWTYVVNDVKGEEIIGTFYENELQKTNQKEFRIEKTIKKG